MNYTQILLKNLTSISTIAMMDPELVPGSISKSSKYVANALRQKKRPISEPPDKYRLKCLLSDNLCLLKIVEVAPEIRCIRFAEAF